MLAIRLCMMVLCNVMLEVEVVYDDLMSGDAGSKFMYDSLM